MKEYKSTEIQAGFFPAGSTDPHLNEMGRLGWQLRAHVSNTHQERTIFLWERDLEEALTPKPVDAPVATTAPTEPAPPPDAEEPPAKPSIAPAQTKTGKRR